jgi:peptidoglycan/LPS O-acetylase OafA/YrhL
MAPVPSLAAKEPARRPVHLQHVEGMRALAAYVVFVNHAFAQVWLPGKGAPPRLLSAFSYSLVAGHLSVTVFIVISGFCLSLPVVGANDTLRGGVTGFLKRRARRILPPYYGAMAVALILIWTVLGKATGSLWDVPIRVTPIAVVSHLLLVQNFFATGAINYVFWSIAVEWQIYFLFPVLVWSWRRFGPAATVVAALVVGYGVRAAFVETRIDRASTHYLGLFALGMLAAYLAQSAGAAFARARAVVPWGTVAVAGLGVVCALSVWWGWERSPDHFAVLDFPVGVATMATLVLCSRVGGGRVAGLLAWKPLAFIGTFSYSVYLMHAPLLQILWLYVLVPAHFGPVAMFGLLMTAGALAVLGASYAFFRVFEEPFMRQSRRPDRPATTAIAPPPSASLVRANPD